MSKNKFQELIKRASRPKPWHGFWDHRIIRYPDRLEKWHYRIHEVYYDTRGLAYAWTGQGCQIGSDSIKGLRQQLKGLNKCLLKPVLKIKGEKLIQIGSGRPARL